MRTLVSDKMSRAISRWYGMYVDKPEWADDEVKPLGLPRAIAKEFAQVVSSEMTITADGGPRADFINEQLTRFQSNVQNSIELCMALAVWPLSRMSQVETSSSTARAPRPLFLFALTMEIIASPACLRVNRSRSTRVTSSSSSTMTSPTASIRFAIRPLPLTRTVSQAARSSSVAFPSGPSFPKRFRSKM